MVSLGTAFKIGLPLALIAGFIMFRKQITEFVGGAAQQVGGGIGEAVGAGFRGLVTELPTGIAQGLAGGALPSAAGFADWFVGGGYLGEQLRRQSKNVVPNQIIVGGSQPTDTDMTITPSNRDYSDSIVVRKGISPTGAKEIINQTQQQYALRLSKFTQIREQSLAKGKGSAEATRYAKQSAGVSPKNVFDVARCNALRQGATPAEALKIARAAIG